MGGRLASRGTSTGSIGFCLVYTFPLLQASLERAGSWQLAAALGLARTCVDESITYARERRTFGKPLVQHQVIRHKIVDMSMP